MPNIRIPLMRSTFFQEKETREKLAEFVRTADRLSMGKECEAFEKEFAVFQERTFATMVSNGSAANLALVQALLNLGRLKQGDRVGVSAVTWATNVMPLMQLGLVPVAIDCASKHLNTTSKALEEHITSLAAFFLTNALGFCGDLDAIVALCHKHNVLLMEDNCESLGTRYQKKLLGNFGVASTFSFFVGHHLSTIEGGMICTDDEELHDMLVMVRAHGWDRNLSDARKHELRTKYNVDDFHAKYTFYELAYNVRPTEIAGFLGRVQLPLLQATLVKREENFRAFQGAVHSRPDLYRPLATDHIDFIANFSMPIICTSPKVRMTAVGRFDTAGIENRPVIAGDITRHPFWKKSLSPAKCEEAEHIHACGFYLPNHPDLSKAEVQEICDLIAHA